ncbi:hypothetical protein KUCAC02_018782 [Chaenocephalus aceratus]|uniref:Uncharacterized protein n=1 Tax=Chaenocephalus aceratus TaxID=36190 RepID=A0ACB9WB30_CHAAC|nr:hypothetical protein KUCAC02_018782 [Chaenocephalus aceratus]
MAVRADAATINSVKDFRWSCFKPPQKQTKAKKNNRSAVMPEFRREQETARRQAAKDKKQKEREERLKESKQPDLEPGEDEEEAEEELPSIFIPKPPSPLYCGFYSSPLLALHTIKRN